MKGACIALIARYGTALLLVVLAALDRSCSVNST